MPGRVCSMLDQRCIAITAQPPSEQQKASVSFRSLSWKKVKGVDGKGEDDGER